MRPSPQYGAARHCKVHLPAPYGFSSFPEPRSHCSGPFVWPSPQYAARVQPLLHVPYVPSLTPLSHSSPASLNPFPHLVLQWISQSLVAVPLACPSSQTSGYSVTPSPHDVSGTKSEQSGSQDPALPVLIRGADFSAHQ